MRARCFPETQRPAELAVARRSLEFANVHHTSATQRQHAAINLLSLAIDTADEPAFRKWRAHLANARLSKRHEILYKLYCARGGRIFEDAAHFETLLDEALEIALQASSASINS